MAHEKELSVLQTLIASGSSKITKLFEKFGTSSAEATAILASLKQKQESHALQPLYAKNAKLRAKHQRGFEPPSSDESPGSTPPSLGR